MYLIPFSTVPGLATILPKAVAAENLPPPPSVAPNSTSAPLVFSQEPRSPPTETPSSSSNPSSRQDNDAQTQSGLPNSSSFSSKVPKRSSELTEEAAKKLSTVRITLLFISNPLSLLH